MDPSSSSSAASGCDARVEVVTSLCCVCHSADDEGLGSTGPACCANSEPRRVREDGSGFIAVVGPDWASVEEKRRLWKRTENAARS